jgi:hypothetical protein
MVSTILMCGLLAVAAPFGIDFDHYNASTFDKLSARLQLELKEADGPDEILALLSGGYEGGGRGQIVVRFKGDQARLTFSPDADHFYVRNLSVAESKELRGLAESKEIRSLGTYDHYTADGTQYLFAGLSRTDRWQVSMNNPQDDDADSAYNRLCRAFQSLLGGPSFELSYAATALTPGLEILADDPVWEVTAVRIVSGQILLQIKERDMRNTPHPRAAGFKSVARKPRTEERAWKEGPLWVAWPSGKAATKKQLASPSTTGGRNWAAQLNVERGSALVGVYDTQHTFTTMKEIPAMWIVTDQVWADEAAKQIYFTHQGDLLRVSF